MTLGFNIGFLEIGWVDLLDILVVGLLMYEVYRLIRNSIASRIFLGALILYLLYHVVKAAGMTMLTSILDKFMAVGVIAAVVIFQQEIRKFLLMLGKGSMFTNEGLLRRWFNQEKPGEDAFSLQPAVEAARSMTHHHTGALIVFSRGSELRHLAETGDEIDAILSKRLLLTIFNKTSPMHDGAVLVVNGRIKAARCVLPVSESSEIPASLGLRHRAAVGVSELTDTVVLVVSEEKGQMSIAYNGRLETNLSATEVRNRLNYYLFEKSATPGGTPSQASPTSPTATEPRISPPKGEQVTA